MANKKRGYYSIKLGGKNRTMHFSMNFWANFTDILGIDINQLGEIFTNGFSLSKIRALVYSGLLAYDQEQGKEIDYNEFTVGAWLDDIDADEITNIINAMTETRLLGNDLNMGIDRNVKKSTKGK
jgi:hypothetical protein